MIIHNSRPEVYERWLGAMIQTTVDTFEGDERLLFVNAWNEWAEGNHLEPDHRWGRVYSVDAPFRHGRTGSRQPAAEGGVTQHRMRVIVLRLAVWV